MTGTACRAITKPWRGSRRSLRETLGRGKWPDHTLVGALGEQLRGCGVPGRMLKGGGDFGQRGQDKSPEVQTGVGDLQLRSVDGLGAVEQNVQIDFARTFCKIFFAAHLRLDGAKGWQ